MAAPADLGYVLRYFTGGLNGNPEHIWLRKVRRVGAAAAQAPVVGQWTSLWQYNGTLGQGSAPGAVAAPTNATAGSMFQTDPPTGLQKWCTAVAVRAGNMAAAAAPPGVIMIYDRLLHISGLSGTVNTSQTVGGSLTRYTDGAGNQVYGEIYTAIGSTGTTAKVSYTDQAGNTGNNSAAATFGGTGFSEAQRMIPFQLASGDTGAQAVASVSLVASTLTAGNFGITVVHPLLYLSVPQVGWNVERNYATGIPGLFEIKPGACLAAAFCSQTTSVLDFEIELHTITC